MRGKKSNNIASSVSFMHVALLLLCAVLVSSHLIGGLYASYITESGDDDDARVIQFKDLTINNYEATPNLLLMPGCDLAIDPLVNFGGSESSTYVFLEVTVSDHWEIKTVNGETVFYVDDEDDALGGDLLSWTLNSDWHPLEGSSETGSFVFYYTGDRLIPNTVITNAQIVSGGIVDVSKRMTKKDLDDLADLDLQFRCKAVQSGGFFNEANPPLAAWEQLKNNGG